jgi:hypothetical protein
METTIALLKSLLPESYLDAVEQWFIDDAGCDLCDFVYESNEDQDADDPKNVQALEALQECKNAQYWRKQNDRLIELRAAWTNLMFWDY